MAVARLCARPSVSSSRLHSSGTMVLTTTHGFSGVLAECSRNYYSDPDEWAALFKVAGDDGKGRWRVLFPTRLNETDERAFDEAAIQERLQKFFPKPGSYPVVHRNIYHVHQRVAASFRHGRVFLAGDFRACHSQQSAGRTRTEFRHSRRDGALLVARM